MNIKLRHFIGISTGCLAALVASVPSASAQNQPYIGIYGTVVGGRLAGNGPFYGIAQVDSVSADYPDATEVTQQALAQSPIVFSGSALDGYYSDTIALRDPNQLRIQAAAPKFLYYSYFDDVQRSLYEVNYEGGTTAYIRNYRDYVTIYGPFPANTSIPVLFRAHIRGTLQAGPANQGDGGKMSHDYGRVLQPVPPRDVDVSVYASANFGASGQSEFSANIPGTSRSIDVVQEYAYTAFSLVAGQTPPILYPAGQLTVRCNNGASADVTVSFEVVVPSGYTASSELGTAGSVVFPNARPSFTDAGDVTAPNSGPQTFGNWATEINPGAPEESDQRLEFLVTANSNPYLFAAGPAISPDGTLSFTPTAGMVGNAQITVVLHDNGGTALGGIDTSLPHTFFININGVDTPPAVTSLQAESPYELLVRWSEPVAAPSAITPGNYSLGGGLSVLSATLVNPITVRLGTSRQGESTTYALHITGVQDTTGHATQIDTTFRSLQYAPGQIRLRTWSDDAGVFSAFASEGIANRPPIRDELLPGYFSGENLGDVYFGQLRGWFTPDATDNYVFFCASDDDSELYLSTDDNPASKQRIARVPGWTSAREWNKYPEQRSASVPLQAGQHYYLELVWREGTGGDHGAVAVKRASSSDPANGTGELGGSRVGNYVHSTPFNNPPVANAGGPYVIDQGDSLTLDASASSDPDPADSILQYYWDLNNDGTYDFNVATPTLTITPIQLASFAFGAGTHTITLRVADTRGATGTATTTLTIRASQTITFGQIPPHTYGDAPFTVPVSASSGLPVTLTSSDASVATVSGNIVTIVGAGTTTLTASQPGDANYQPATPVAVNYTIAKATPVNTWAAPADINCQIPLGPIELNAVANVPGTFTYSPAAGTTLPLGNGQVLSVHFIPTDTANYNDASASTSINVRLDAGAVVAWERTPPDAALVALGFDPSGQLGVAGYSWANGFDYYVAKYASSNGALLWENRYNGPANAYDQGMAGAVDASGNVIVTGRSYNGPFESGNADYLTAKYASGNGVLLWSHRYYGSANGEDVATHVAVDSAGNVIVSGYSHNGSNYDFYTAKYAAADGSLLWEKRYDGPGGAQDYPQGLAVDLSGNVVVTGDSNNDFYTAKYAAADGSLLWEKRYAGPGLGGSDDRPTSLALDRNGNVIVNGFSSGATSGYDFYTAKYSSADGVLLWEKRYTNAGNVDEFATDVKVDLDGNIFVTGERSNGSKFDYLTVKYASADGALIWERQFANNLGFLEGQPRLAVLPNGNVAFTGLIRHPDNTIEEYTASYASADGQLRWEDRVPTQSNIPRPVAVDDRNDVVTTGSLTVFYQVGAQPVVTLIGSASISITNNGVFTDPGATALDGCGGPLPLTVTGNVDVQTPGTYLLVYSATDAAGQKASATRTVTVGRITPVITWANPADIIYGTPLGSAQLNATANAPGSFTYAPAAGAILNAGSAQSLQVFFTPTDTQKYFPTSKTVSINVLKASASLALSGLNQTYDGTAKTVTVLTTPAGLSGASVTYPGSPSPPVNAGAYTVAASLNNPNYSASPVSGSLVIAKADQTINFTPPAAVTYGSALSLFAIASSGLPAAYTVTGPATLSGSTLTFVGLGTVTVTATQPGNANYNPAPPASRSISVNKALLQVIADNKTRVFGALNPMLTYTYSGFVLNETASVLKGFPSLSTSATSSSPVGLYPINITQGNLSAANYSFTFVSGALTVAAANTVVTAANVNAKFGAASTTLTGNVSPVSPSNTLVNEGIITFVVRNSSGVQIGQAVSGPVSRGAANASFPTATLAKGTYNISASYTGASAVPNFNNSVSSTTATLVIK